MTADDSVTRALAVADAGYARAAGGAVTVTEWAVQTLLGSGDLHVGNAYRKRAMAEESALRLVAINEANCWLVSRQRVVYPDEVTEWTAASP